MAGYTISISTTARKQMKALDRPVQKRIAKKLKSLENNPTPGDATQLVGSSDTWRIRIGDYRVVYTIHQGRLEILILKAQHRRDVYR